MISNGLSEEDALNQAKTTYLSLFGWTDCLTEEEVDDIIASKYAIYAGLYNSDLPIYEEFEVSQVALFMEDTDPAPTGGCIS